MVYNPEYYSKNKEHILSQVRQWKINHPERYKSYFKNRAVKNNEKLLESLLSTASPRARECFEAVKSFRINIDVYGEKRFKDYLEGIISEIKKSSAL